MSLSLDALLRRIRTELCLDALFQSKLLKLIACFSLDVQKEKSLNEDPGLLLKVDVKWTKSSHASDVIHPVLIEPSTFYEAKRAGLVHRKASERAAEREKKGEHIIQHFSLNDAQL